MAVVTPRCALRDFRSLRGAPRSRSASALTVVHGPNGAGKTNLLEALYFGCTGALVPHRERARARALRRRRRRASRSTSLADDGAHALERRLRARASPSACASTARRSSASLDVPARPLVSVFLPDRLELVKGAPSLRRAHLDQVVAALWPARAGTRARRTRGPSRSATRCSARVARRRRSRAALAAWDRELARHGARAARPTARAAVERAAPPLRRPRARDLGLDGDAGCAYRPRSRGGQRRGARGRAARARSAPTSSAASPARAAPRRPRAPARRARAAGLRVPGRAAPRPARAAARRARRARRERGAPPLMLLDDVMSELDAEPARAPRRAPARGGQARDHHDRPGARARAPTTRGSCALRVARRHASAGRGARGRVRRRPHPGPLGGAVGRARATLAPATPWPTSSASGRRPPARRSRAEADADRRARRRAT